MKQRRYNVGFDVGLNSLGFAAIEIDEQGMPIRILKAASEIHDGGVDPNTQKTGDSRRSQAGIARRTRRMRRRRKARLERLDKTLTKLGFPIVNESSLHGFDVWKIRALAASGFIEDDNERKCAISIAYRHIARHRGWRNPYTRVESLLNVAAPESDQYQQLRDNAIRVLGGEYIPDAATPAQIIDAVLAESSGPAMRIRTSTGSRKLGDRPGLISTRLMQADYAYELRTIFEQQHVPDDVARELMFRVFDAKSPRGSAEKHVGRDPLAPAKSRAMKASLAFQRYRIASMIVNLRVNENGEERLLTVEEKQRIYDRLASQAVEKDLTWADICSDLGISRNQLKGVGSLTADGEERVTSRPPQLTSVQRIAGLSDSKLRKSLLDWWNHSDDSAREAMIALLSNSVDIDDKKDDQTFVAAVDFIESLDDSALSKLDTIDLPAGRAAYSTDTLNKLTERMLTTDDDLHAARKVLFNVDDNWRPPQPAIGAPLGNASVDRVLKIVDRFLMAAQKRWGAPVAVQIEHVRNGFASIPSARKDKRDYEKTLERRKKYRDQQAERLKDEFGLDKIREDSIRRLEAITRQNGQCLYCGRTITLSTCEMDHIVPRKGVGSTNTRDNFAAVCKLCNQMKSNTPFAAWARTDSAKQRGVSLSDAISLVRMFNIDSGEMNGREARNFEQGVIRRLSQTEWDEPIDNRSIESVAWMADELHRRIDWYYNSSRYEGHGTESTEGSTKVRVYQGSLTSEARKASGIDGQIHFAGASYKTRLDRRHHAIDAAVIAMMTQGAAQTLQIRRNLRASQNAVGYIEPDEIAWRDYPAEHNAGYAAYAKWLDSMYKLLDLLNDALDNDRIPVIHAQRYSLGNSIAHDATIRPLDRVLLGSAISVETINKASTPALYCALTRLPDYSAADGLPASENREISVNGIRYSAHDNITFFSGSSAQIAVQNGSADIGSAIHHARIYKCYKENKKGIRTYFYGMIRVFQADLLRAAHDDLFTCQLPVQSVSMRYADKKVVDAILSGRAEYRGYLVVGDEIEVEFNDQGNNAIASFKNFFEHELSVSPDVVNKWVVAGLMEPTKIRLRPSILSQEGMDRIKEAHPVDASILHDVESIFDKGWRMAVGTASKYKMRVVRRNVFGEKRYTSKKHMSVCWGFD